MQSLLKANSRKFNVKLMFFKGEKEHKTLLKS